MASSQEHVEGFFASIGLAKLAYHWHVLVLSALTCNFTVAFSRFISPILFPRTYNALKGHKRFAWDMHAVSMLHCILVVALSIHLLFDENLLRDKVFGYDAYAGNVYAIACGYFFWDVFASLYQAREDEYAFVLHGACCFGVYIFAFVSGILS
ncbi:759_t:CDS:2 [Ambispora gerdemannii]|uniref:759_t:CDS:1 n=1 Tax=Ambispora gerdemannii TaxID=144530 RepID=A0A9N8UYP1_9GLOM|nr:759_t:CDS:2 [Ambispora gerdemannii]